MDFVNLNRLFAPVKNDADITIEWGEYWGRKYGGWLDWDQLLKHRRVALLAEALSGKTQELQHRAKYLQQQGKHAFFVRIDDLAGDSFESALIATDVAAFQRWKTEECSDAWFFLDSVDEARLNNKQLTTALRKFSKELQLANLGRAHILVSCRASDWKGKADREALEEHLPYPALIPRTTAKEPDEVLLAPIFNREQKTLRTPETSSEPRLSELLIVQLAPLTNDQKGRLAKAAGVPDSMAFLDAVNLSGLDAMTERPGDLIDLLGYWKDNGSFGTLAQMTEEGIKRKLREEDNFRPDASAINFDFAREGAERLAAALVLGKTFTVKAPAQEVDSSAAAGSLDLTDLFSDWHQDQINALLRRGLFAPATYGRIRFHHRSSQEYLAACWFQRLIGINCPLDEIQRILFVELYGVNSVKPTLRAVAAWLSLWQPSIRDEVITREPVSLIIHGDPKSLPLQVREALLVSYADLDSKGHLNVEMIDYRAAWMFSDPALGDALKRAWSNNQRDSFRIQLLRFIEEGSILSCADLARSVALDEMQSQYARIVAARAMASCEDTTGLEGLARQIRVAPDRLNARLAPEFALILFPSHLTVSDLIDLIDRSEPARPYQSEGFSRHLVTLHSRASNRAAQKQMVLRVAELCLSKPHLDEFAEISRRHAELSSGLAELALAELSFRREGDVEAGLIKLLMAIERSQASHDDSDSLSQLAQRVKRDKTLNRELLWADARIDRHGRPRETLPTYIWQIGAFTKRLWSTDISDIDWLVEDCRKRPEAHERQIAFSALYQALYQAGQQIERRSILDDLVANDLILRADLDSYETPPASQEYDAKHKANLRKQQEQQVKDKQSWIDFRDELKANPSILDASGALKSWPAGLFRLYHLTNWVKSKARQSGLEGPRHWQLLSDGFGQAVADHYAHAMRKVWRELKPERPVYHGNGSYTTKNTSLLAIDSIAIDSADSNWENLLTDNEVNIAMRHGCYIGTCSDDWFDRLVRARSPAALKVLQSAVVTEYKSEGARTDLLVQAAYNETAARAIITKQIFVLIKATEPIDDLTFERALLILARGVEYIPIKDLERLALNRLQLHLSSSNEKRAIEYLGLYAKLRPDSFANQVSAMLIRKVAETDGGYVQRMQHWLGLLFGGVGRNGSATGALSKISVTPLLRLVKLAYSLAPIQRDESSSGEEITSRRDEAESVRSALLNALIARPGAEAFYAILELAANPSFTGNSLRLRELAHGKAESDGDLAPWKASEVSAFGLNYAAPVKTGADLLRLVMTVLSDIATSFDQADASSRGVLALAVDENVVQNWLAEQLNLRAKSRYHAQREPEVAQKNEPDIIVSSSTAEVQVAIEVKNANMGWTVKQLEGALKGQLARDYLRTNNRRHGVLVISLHKPRTWRRDGQVWSFDELMTHLEGIASTVTKNETGSVEAKAFGIDSTERISK
jgi:hypothetical protein